TLAVANRYDHTDNLWDTIFFEWEVELDGVPLARGILTPPSQSPATTAKAAMETTSLDFELPSLATGTECWLLVTGRLRRDMNWAGEGHEVGHVQLPLGKGEVRA
ncbi:unnamed protein product, partial [Discosporangium mesarthrocarpum]